VRTSAGGAKLTDEIAKIKTKYDASNKVYSAGVNAMLGADGKYGELKKQYDTTKAQGGKVAKEVANELTKTEGYLALKAKGDDARTRHDELKAKMAPLLKAFLNADAAYTELSKKIEESKSKGEKKTLQRSLYFVQGPLVKKFNQTNNIGKLYAAAGAESQRAQVAERNFSRNGLQKSAVYVAAKKAEADAKKAWQNQKNALLTDYSGKSKLSKEMQGWRDQIRELEGSLKTLIADATATATADVDKKVIAATIALKAATAKAYAKYEPQIRWIKSFTYQANGGYYNFSYAKYYKYYANKKLGGGEVRDKPQTVRKIYDAWQKKGDWHTEVDWDWRMKAEIDGSINKAPQMKKWLEKTRGSVK
jgi:hypothetical protein